MAKIGWIKPTVSVYVTIMSENGDAQRSLTTEWLYKNRNKYNYLFLVPVPEEYDSGGAMYYCINDYTFFNLDDGVGVAVGGNYDNMFDKDGKQSGITPDPDVPPEG